METTIQGLGFMGYSPAKVDRIWGMWGSYSNILTAIFYLLKGTIEIRVFRFFFFEGSGLRSLG